MPASKSDIKPEVVQGLATVGSTDVEIADYCDCSTELLRRWFAKELKKGRAIRRIQLRKLQNRMAADLNAAMLVFLGKNELGQTNQGHESEDGPPQPSMDPKMG